MAKHKFTLEYEIDVDDPKWLKTHVKASVDGDLMWDGNDSFKFLLLAIDDMRFHADSTIQMLKNTVMWDIGDKYSWPVCTNTLITGKECTRPVAQHLADQTDPMYQLCAECANELEIDV